MPSTTGGGLLGGPIPDASVPMKVRKYHAEQPLSLLRQPFAIVAPPPFPIVRQPEIPGMSNSYVTTQR